MKMNEAADLSESRVLVIDVETAPDPIALSRIPPRERSKTVSTALHRIGVASMLEAEEVANGRWRVSSIKSLVADGALGELDVLRRIDRALLSVANNRGTLVTFNGRRHDTVSIRLRAAAHLAFGMTGIAALSSMNHRDLMTDSIAGGGQWFKLRDVAAGLGIPVAHEVPNRGIGAVSRAARKGEVDIAVTFLLFLYDLSGGTSRFVIWTAAVGTNGQQRPERCRKVY
jgi:hypothetical protein